MKELKTIAIMRLMYPNALIPASLDVEGISGLKDRITAGANLVTSVIPPKKGLSGVAKSHLDVDIGGRTVAEVEKVLGAMGLRVATSNEYKEYISNKS
jgi:methylornithine synthase